MRAATKDTDTYMPKCTYKTWIFRLADIRNGSVLGVAVSLHTTYRKGYFV